MDTAQRTLIVWTWLCGHSSVDTDMPVSSQLSGHWLCGHGCVDVAQWTWLCMGRPSPSELPLPIGDPDPI